jgi:hypothetical protein
VTIAYVPFYCDQADRLVNAPTGGRWLYCPLCGRPLLSQLCDRLRERDDGTTAERARMAHDVLPGGGR